MTDAAFFSPGTEVQVASARQPATAALAGPSGHPFHPMLVTVPIGAWICSLVFDIASHLDSRPGFLAQASQWLIAIGVLGALAAAVAGFLDLVAIPADSRAFRIACIHMSINLLLTFGYAGNFAWRYKTDVPGAPVGLAMIALSAVSIAALGVSGYLGGKLTFRYGVRVTADLGDAGYDQRIPPGNRPPSRHRA
jgi:uncharacterized membrane protein